MQKKKYRAISKIRNKNKQNLKEQHKNFQRRDV